MWHRRGSTGSVVETVARNAPQHTFISRPRSISRSHVSSRFVFVRRCCVMAALSRGADLLSAESLWRLSRGYPFLFLPRR
jgi:hypothetical protein